MKIGVHALSPAPAEMRKQGRLTDRPFPVHAAVRRLAPTYLAWLKRKDLSEPKL